MVLYWKYDDALFCMVIGLRRCSSSRRSLSKVSIVRQLVRSNQLVLQAKSVLTIGQNEQSNGGRTPDRREQTSRWSSHRKDIFSRIPFSR